MTVIQRVPSPSEPITVTIGDSTYTIDPFDKAANLAGAIAAGEAREKGLSEAKQMLFRRIGEVVEMMRGWTNVKFDDGPDAEFNTVNAYALFLSDDGDNIAISLWSAANSAREKVDAQKKVSVSSLNGIGGASTEKAGENSVKDADRSATTAPQPSPNSANTSKERREKKQRSRYGRSSREARA